MVPRFALDGNLGYSGNAKQRCYGTIPGYHRTSSLPDP